MGTVTKPDSFPKLTFTRPKLTATITAVFKTFEQDEVDVVKAVMDDITAQLADYADVTVSYEHEQVESEP